MTRSDSVWWHGALVLAATVLAVLATGASSVAAHAQLEGSTPISGTPLDAMPGAIMLAFTEPVATASASFGLLGPDGILIPLGPPAFSNDDRSIELPVASGQAIAGTYSLLWSVVSATDGHDSSGLVVFSVGTGRAPPEAFLTSAARASWWDIAAEAALLVALAAMAALLILLTQGGAPVRLDVRLAVGVVVVAAAGLTAREPDRWLPDSQAGQIRLAAGAMGMLAALTSVSRRRSALVIGWIALVGSVIAISASGHAAGADRPRLAILVAAIHALIALGWSGMLLAITIQARTDTPVTLIRRLNRIGLVGLALLIAAGVVISAIHLPGDRSVTDSTYGRTLLLKVLLVVLVLAFAATNRWVVTPWLGRRDATDGQSRLILTAEAGTLVVILGFAAALSGTSPPADSTLINVAPRASVIDLDAIAGDLRVQVDGQIAGTPEDQVIISVADLTGSFPSDIQRVIVATAYGDETAERFDASPVEDGTGQFSFPAIHLGRTGVWDVEVIVRRSGVTDVIAGYEIDTASWQGATPRLGTETWRRPVVPAGAVILLGLALLVPLATLWAIRRQGPLAPLSGGIIMIAVAMIATGFGIQALQRTSARTEGHELAMPSVADPVAGGAVWTTYCLTCHGENGRGIDSPDPLHQHGSQADLTDRRSMQLSDGDLYWLISTGVGNSQMPAYGDALTDQERWDLVAYIRQLQNGGE